MPPNGSRPPKGAVPSGVPQSETQEQDVKQALAGILATLLGGSLCVSGAAAAEKAVAAVVLRDGPTTDRVSVAFTEGFARSGLSGAALLVETFGGGEIRFAAGDMTMDTLIPVASAGKWFTVATVLAVVDDGLMSLDDPVSKYLPAFEGEKATMTIRQCLAVTSGLARRYAPIYDPDLDFDEVVDGIAALPLEAPPGTKLIYGGLGFHVAGAAAVAASGMPWHRLFDEKVKRPLGLTRSVFGSASGAEGQGFTIRPVEARNPWLGGGLLTTMNEYERFLRMVANEGTFDGRRVLSEESILELRKNQTDTLPVEFTLHPVRATRYALGSWAEKVDASDRALLIRDMGAWGFNPWIDFERGYFAILGVYAPGDFEGMWKWAGEIEKALAAQEPAVSDAGRPSNAGQ